MTDRTAIIAGAGAPPIQIAETLRATDRDYIVIALDGFAKPKDFDEAPTHTVRLGGVGKILSLFESEAITHIVFAGAVKRPSIFQLRPDATALKLMAKLGYANLGDDTLLTSLMNYLEIELGLKVLKAADLMPKPEFDAQEWNGCWATQETLSEQDIADITRGRTILDALSQMDVGQAIIVQEGAVLGIEAIEGTDNLIRRCVQNKRPGATGGVLVKLPKIGQDDRADLPTMGVETLKRLSESGFTGLAFDPAASMIVDPDAFRQTAKALNIYLYPIESRQKA